MKLSGGVEAVGAPNKMRGRGPTPAGRNKNKIFMCLGNGPVQFTHNKKLDMGKSKPRNRNKNRADPKAKPIKPPTDPELASIRETRILPVLKYVQFFTEKLPFLWKIF